MQIGNIVWFILGKTLCAPLHTMKILKNKLTSNLPPKISHLKSWICAETLHYYIARVFPDVPANNHLVSVSVLRVSESQNESEVKHQGGAGFIKMRAKIINILFNVPWETVDPCSCCSWTHFCTFFFLQAQINQIHSVMSQDCVVVLGELIQSNRDLAAKNEKLHQEHEKTSKHQAETP